MSETVHFSQGLSMPFVPGVIVDGKYRLERPIARGGMGFIVLARHVKLDQPIALKFMHAWLAHTVPKGAARFLDEARAAARLRSDYVARVSDTGTFQGSPYMVMEYLEGETLEALLERQPIVPIAEAVRFALQASEGLAEAHTAGIIHRDLKPANLFLARQSDGSSRVKLLDFGISKMVGGAKGPNPAWDISDPTEAEEVNGALCGSPLYMAPEQMLSSSRTDARTDIWALGVVLYEMLVGVRPFIGDTLADLCARVMDPHPEPLRTLRPEVPVVLESAVMQCLQRDPDHRFQSVSALAHALANSWPGGTRLAAARIDRIMNGRGARGSRPDPDEAAAMVPQGELTNTSYNRVVDGLADLMKVKLSEPRTPERTPPPVAAQIIELDEVEIRFRPRLWTWIDGLVLRVKGALVRHPAPAIPLDPSVTRPSVLMSARVERRRVGIAALVVGAGLTTAVLLAIVRATPSRPRVETATQRASPASSAMGLRVDPPAPALPVVPPSVAPGVPAAGPVVAHTEDGWKPVPLPSSAPPADSSAPSHTSRHARGEPPPAVAASAPRTTESTRAAAGPTSNRAPAAKPAAPIGTAGFGGRE